MHSYVVDYRGKSPQTAWLPVARADLAALSETILKLDNGVVYEIRIAAVNDVGLGAWLETEGTPEARRPGEPVGLKAFATGNSMLLSWSEPDDDGGADITSYVVRYRPQDDLDAWTEVIRSDKTALSETIGDLGAGAVYVVQVAAVNVADTGAFAEIIFKLTTAGGVPGPVPPSGSVPGTAEPGVTDPDVGDSDEMDEGDSDEGDSDEMDEGDSDEGDSDEMDEGDSDEGDSDEMDEGDSDEGDSDEMDEGDSDEGDSDEGDSDEGDSDEGDSDEGDSDEMDEGDSDEGDSDEMDEGDSDEMDEAVPSDGGERAAEMFRRCVSGRILCSCRVVDARQHDHYGLRTRSVLSR